MRSVDNMKLSAVFGSRLLFLVLHDCGSALTGYLVLGSIFVVPVYLRHSFPKNSAFNI